LGGAGEALGRSQGGFSTKIHLRAEGNGKPITAVLTGGERHEQVALEAVLDQGAIRRQGRGRPRLRPRRVAGDKGYSSPTARRRLRRRGITPVIPTTKGQPRQPDFDRQAYRERNRIEVVFTQMTKAHLLAAGAEGDDVADLDLTIGDQPAVDQPLHELALLGEVSAGQTRPNPAAEVRSRSRPAGELGPPIHLRRQLAGLRLKGLQPLLQRLPPALVFRQRDDGEQVGLGQPLQLSFQAALAAA
jgi:Transposase DDE domain